MSNIVLTIVNQIAFPLILEKSLWIFPFGQISIHFWHIKQSPLVTSEPCSGSSVADGQFLLHPLQPVMQDSLFLRREKNGKTGSNENTAPIGQRNWQKNRSFTHIPITIRISNTTPAAFCCIENLPIRSNENTSHGLLPFIRPSFPVKQSTRIPPSNKYFKTGTS